ncbi:uncharacterized protein TNCV_775771 [Trichonephila clavipes]|nr:uncharacterized protein TNCV_775771 [Trichonephila clavipes]
MRKKPRSFETKPNRRRDSLRDPKGYYTPEGYYYVAYIEGLGSNSGKYMDVCKCIVPARHGGTLYSSLAASPLVRLVDGEEKWEASDYPQSVLPLNWGGIEPKRTVTCMVLKATTNNRRYLALCHDEFRGPRSGLCRSGGISNSNRVIIVVHKLSDFV